MESNEKFIGHVDKIKYRVEKGYTDKEITSYVDKEGANHFAKFDTTLEEDIDTLKELLIVDIGKIVVQ